MDDVTFDEENPQRAQPSISRQPRGLYKFVIRTGLAKDQKGAQRALIVIAIGAIIIGVAYPLLIL